VSKSRVAITAGAVFLSAALAVSLFSGRPEADQSSTIRESASPIPSLNPEQVFTWNCEIPEHKPESILITCADGGIYVEKIKWSTWSQEGATGSGNFSENLCEPSCAEGKRVTAPVNLILSNLTEQNGKYYLRTLDITTSDGKDFPWGRADSFQWDLMEFAKMMDSNNDQ
jgi:hypothetical protein